MMSAFRVFLAVIGLLFSGNVLPQEQLFTLHSDPWMNLHHLLYHTARSTHLGEQRLRGPVRMDNADLNLALDDDELKVWNAALEAYAERATADLLFDPQLRGLNNIIASGEAAIREQAANEPLLRALLNAMPVFRQHLWQQHDAANRDFMAKLQEGIARHGEAVGEDLARRYESRWPDAPIRVDVVKYANWAGAYTNNRPNHVVMSSGDARHGGLLALEILFHEAGHTLPLGANLMKASQAASDEAGVDEGRLWHSYIFYAAGEAVRSVDADHVPYAEANGLWERGQMSEHKHLLDKYFGAGSLAEQFSHIHAAHRQTSD